MDPQSKKLLEETHALAKENNNMLHKIRHAQKTASFLRSIYWLIIIGLGIGAFYFTQPYVESVTTFFKDTGTTINNFKNTFSQ